jgi:hypothetical protein
MKKLSILVAAMLIASFSFAQIQPKVFRQEAKVAGMPVLKHVNNSKTAAGSQWFEYPATIYEYFGYEATGDDWVIGRVAADSNGLTYYSDGDVGHGFWFGLSQTYDFGHSVWDEAALGGQISMNNTNSYNIDSVAIIGHYNRGAMVPAGNVDTLVVAVLTTLTENDLVTLSINDGATPIVRYYGVPYDVNTHMSLGASIYKVPLTAEDCADTSETGGLYMAEYDVPINLQNITNKVVNVAYTLKRGYEVPMDDNIENHSRFYGAIYKDPRPGYYPHNQSGWFTPTDDIFYNPNQGAIIGEDNLNQTDPTAWYCEYFYPAPLWNEAVQYPWILTKISCNDCEIVNVPEIEKTNMTVYPNPATNNFTVNMGNDEKASIQLFNIVGQQVYSETFTGSTTVSVANLHSGVYMLKVNQNGKVNTTKVVVK